MAWAAPKGALNVAPRTDSQRVMVSVCRDGSAKTVTVTQAPSRWTKSISAAPAMGRRQAGGATVRITVKGRAPMVRAASIIGGASRDSAG